MKLETILLIAAAGVAGYALAHKKLAAAKAPAKAVDPALPTAQPSVIIEEYDVYDYGPGWGYGYPYPRGGGGRRGGGGHHHHGGHH